MADRSVDVLHTGGSYFEAPRWHDGRWWVSDFYRQVVQAVTPDGVAETVVRVRGQPSGLGWTPDGALLVVSMKDRLVLRRDAGGAVEQVADIGAWCGGHANDMVVDSAGRAYVGNFGFDLMGGGAPRTTGLVRIDPDGTVTLAADDLVFPNGMVITPDGATLVVAETLAARFSAFTVGAGGELADRRVWAQLADTPTGATAEEVVGALEIAPDGCTLDAEGHVWAADAVGGRAIRVAPGGRIVDEVHAPGGLGVFACMLGGDDGHTLLMCAAPDFLEHLRSQARDAVLLTTRVDVPHAGLP